MATLTHQGALLVSAFIFTCLPELFATSCQVYPSEYAYRDDSVTRSESASANCWRYTQGSYPRLRTEDYIHCNGAKLRLTDSCLGSEQFSESNYIWPPGSRSSQLLFIFPTRVNLTAITLHYYSDSDRGLPRLRFYAVPDDFDIWDAPFASYRYVEVAAVPPGRRPASRSNILNFNTAKVLMIKFGSAFHFAVSEVVFFTCVGTAQIATCTTIMPVTTTFSALPTTEPSMAGSGHDAIHPLQNTDSIMDSDCQTSLANSSLITMSCSVREGISWTLVTILTILFIGSLTINIITLWIYKKRQSKDNNVETAMCEMEGNPCYETSNLKKTADTAGLQEAHVYERVKQN